MNRRWAILLAASLVAFSSLVITWQIRHYNDLHEAFSSLPQTLLRGKALSGIPGIAERERQTCTLSAIVRQLDLRMPNDARVFITDMTGPTNYDKIGYYFSITYYLFPREIGVCVDQPTCLTSDGFLGTTAKSDQEILANGFDAKIDISGATVAASALRELPIKNYRNPEWFDSETDTVMAFLLPLLTALAGMWLLRYLVPSLSGQMPFLQQLAYGLGLGMMFVAALTLGIKLCGFHGRGVIFMVAAVGAIAEVWRDRRVLLTKITDSYWKTIRHPIPATFLVTGFFVFLILFRMAGLEGLMDGDAMRWMLKAKIMHLSSGRELVQWFSNPRLAHAHLDYPTLVPSLHAATYDSIGHVNDFVTKFWPTWMLLFLVTSLASLNRAANHWRPVWLFALLGLLLLPVTQQYVQWEGSTLPMAFFTVLGFIQCALWLIGKDRARLGLGLTLLFGGAMTHFEGFIFLALVGGWMLLLPSARPWLKPSPVFWRGLAFCCLAALPFVCLRMQIPALHYESGWASYALHHPGSTLSAWPGVFLIQLARLFMSADFANWSRSEGTVEWIGKWDGLSSLYNPSTMGLPWLCLLLTVALWFAIPARRQAVIWVLVMFVTVTAALTGVFASFISIKGSSETISYTLLGERYLLPMLFAWFATIMTMFFADRPSPASTLASDTGATNPTGSANAAGHSLPALKGGYWLVIGALLIMVLGVLVLPNNESSSPGNRLPNSVMTNPLGVSENNPPENADVWARMKLAVQLDVAGKSAEALQAYREIVRLYPNNPVALNNLAWRLATHPRPELRSGKEAVQLAAKAVKLTGQQQPIYLGTLAAAYAEDGYFAKAIEKAKQARDIALMTGQRELAAKCEEHLKLYSAGKAVGTTNSP